VDIDTWEQAGLYRPEDSRADERKALLEYLTARGATLEQMVEATAWRASPLSLATW